MRAVLLCVVSASLFAQIQDLATTDTGSQLYFSTGLRLKGSSEYTNFKIFEYSNGNYSLVAQTAPTVSSNGSVVQDDLHLPSVSGDGSIVTWDETVLCTSAGCQTPFQLNEGQSTTVGFVSGARLPAVMTTSGSLMVSHNGRYFLTYGQSATAEFYDSQTGIVNPIGVPVTGDRRGSIADDGTVLIESYGSAFLWKSGVTTQLPYSVQARFSADGSTVVFQGVDSADHAGLFAYNLSSGTQTLLASGPPAESENGFCCSTPIGPYFHPWVSNNGQRVLFLNATSSGVVQAFVLNSDGTGKVQLTSENFGIAEAVLSGDGNTVFAVATVGDLLQIDVNSGTVQTLIGGLPTASPGPVVPGSRIYFSGQNLAAADGHSLVSFAGAQPPLLSVSSNQVIFQAPWEWHSNDTVTALVALDAGPFEEVLSAQVQTAAPVFLNVLHSDFRGGLTASDPGLPDEIVVLQMTGLGPVSPGIATGQAAPDSPLSYTQLPVNCSYLNSSVNLPVLFSGLAPEFVGMYQVNVQLTPGVLPGPGLADTHLVCSAGGVAGGWSNDIYVQTGN